jgi:hypothetical protein
MADDAGTEPESEDRDGLADGVEHLQAAAREVIRAGRSLLDAAEGLVDDPAALQGLVGTLGSLAQAAVQRFGAATGSAAGDGDDPDRDDGDDGKVQRIRVS